MDSPFHITPANYTAAQKRMNLSGKRVFMVLLFFLIIFLTKPLWAQDTIYSSIADSTMEKMHSPTKATLMSAFVPGLGQIYNKKWWKVPIIYAGFGVLSYFIYFNTNYYLDYKCAYIESSYGDTAGSYADLVNRYTKDELLTAREYYRRNLEISCLVTAVWYILNILDAAVDAHLFTYNISKDLTMKVRPDITFSNYRVSRMPNMGLTLSLHIK